MRTRYVVRRAKYLFTVSKLYPRVLPGWYIVTSTLRKEENAKVKKRILAVIVSSLLIVSMTVPVLAAGSGNTNKAMEIAIMKMLLGIKDDVKSDEDSSSSSSSSSSAPASTWTNGSQNTDLNASTLQAYINYNALCNTGLAVAAAQWGNSADEYWSFTSPLFVPGSNVVIQEFWTTGESKSTNVKADAKNTASKVKARNAAGSKADTAAACLKVGNQR